ncbi:MAG: acetolactate synthase large subunit [Treponema sp.]|nr:acetolactate synthase large subunit [Treponema sp.]
MKCTGARIVIECLLEQGVDTVFGYPGGAILHIYDELYKNAGRMRHVLTAHEQGASHAADGYARSTGKVGVVMTTSGPGATNIVTGLATAYMDSVPVVAITCNVSRAQLGKDSFQEVNITGITRSVTKCTYIVRDVENLADTIRAAFFIAKSGRPGPVLIDIPKDVTSAMCEYCAPEAYTRRATNRLRVGKEVMGDGGVHFLRGAFKAKDLFNVQRFLKAKSLRRTIKTPVPKEAHIVKVARRINEAQHPVIICGGGVIVSEASDVLKALACKASIPVVATLMGKSAFPNSHALFCGLVGMHGTKAANMAVEKSDLLLAVGTRFSDRITGNTARFAKKSKVIHIDIDPSEINKNICTFGSLVGNSKDVLARLMPLVHERAAGKWNALIDEWKKDVPRVAHAEEELAPQFLFEHVQHKIGENAIVATEVGQHQMWAAQFYEFEKPRTFITSGGLGTMGFGMGAAIGAQIAHPSTRVVNFAGDGSFMMNCNELATIAHYNLPIIIVVLNNGTLGMVRQWQTIFYDKNYSHTTLDFAPDFVKLAESYGIAGFRAKSKDAFVQAFDAALASGKAAVIDAVIDTDEMVLPMIPPGKSVDSLMMSVK